MHPLSERQGEVKRIECTPYRSDQEKKKRIEFTPCQNSQEFTDEYLIKVLQDKVKELGRTPSRREVMHGNAIAQRFGNGSYDIALNQLGFRSNFNRTNKKFIKDTLKSKIDGSSCIEVYEMVLKDEISQFPRYFWQEISESDLRELLQYFFEEKLKWTISDIKNNLDATIFAKYKLGGGMFMMFNGSPFQVVNFTYPNKIKEWELKCTPLNYWTIDKCVEVTKQILEKEKWTDEDIRNTPIYELLHKYRVTTIYSTYFNGSPYDLINAVYPGKFKPWELPKVSTNYWNIETGKEAVKWMIEEKLKWSDEDIKKKYCGDIFDEYKIISMLNQVFDCSPFKALAATYPGKFTEEDLNNVPINYWTKEKAILSIRKILDRLSDEEIKENITAIFFIENGLRYPFQRFFNGKPFMVLDTIYPKRFNKKDFLVRS